MLNAILNIIVAVLALIPMLSTAKFRSHYEHNSFGYIFFSQLVPVLCAGLVNVLGCQPVTIVKVAGILFLLDVVYRLCVYHKLASIDDMPAVLFLTIALNPWLMLPVYVMQCAHKWLKRQQISYSNRSNLIATIVLSVVQITVMPALDAGLQGVAPVSYIELRMLIYAAVITVFTSVPQLRARIKDSKDSIAS